MLEDLPYITTVAAGIATGSIDVADIYNMVCRKSEKKPEDVSTPASRTAAIGRLLNSISQLYQERSRIRTLIHHPHVNH